MLVFALGGLTAASLIALLLAAASIWRACTAVPRLWRPQGFPAAFERPG
jgi:hypothetical protein